MKSIKSHFCSLIYNKKKQHIMPQQVKNEIVHTSFQLSIAKMENNSEMVKYFSDKLSELIKSILSYD